MGTFDEPPIHLITALDCNQWASVAKQSGARGIILTKHHDGLLMAKQIFKAYRTGKQMGERQGRCSESLIGGL